MRFIIAETKVQHPHQDQGQLIQLSVIPGDHKCQMELTQNGVSKSSIIDISHGLNVIHKYIGKKEGDKILEQLTQLRDETTPVTEVMQRTLTIILEQIKPFIHMQ